MPFALRRLAPGIAFVLGAAAIAAVSASGPAEPVIPNDDGTAAHVLNRLAFGPRPGDIERVRAMGVAAWIERQLDPASIPDEAAQARTARFATLSATSRELAAMDERAEEPAAPKGQQGQRARRQAAKAAAAAGAVSPPATGAEPATAEVPPAGAAEPAATPGGKPRPGKPTKAGNPARPAKGQGPNKAVAELTAQKLLLAVESERQLEEVLVDFWFNHFNVFAGKGPTRVYLIDYERDAIRPHVLGRFRDLLGATAKSPAMLYYLDNWSSRAPQGGGMGGANPGISRAHPGQARNMKAGAADRTSEPADAAENPGAMAQDAGVTASAPAAKAPPPRRPRRGLNENYARELLELHTLGVDAGYSQKDVTEVARAFTGWTLEQPRVGRGFTFNPRLHDNGEKVVLGTKLPAGGGIADGERVLDLLSRHPSTARHLAEKLARRFVADDPPEDLVDRAAQRFLDTDGDLRAVVRTIVTSPEFLASASWRAKVKSPFEFVVSSLRATGARIDDATGLAKALRDLGQPLYYAQPPTGYPDRAEAWMSGGALLQRIQFADALVKGRLPGVKVDLANLAGPGDPATRADRLVRALVAGDVSAATRQTIARAAGETQVAALTLGAPEFQRR
jgi:uncharacterized protein (DUF1800 family)